MLSLFQQETVKEHVTMDCRIISEHRLQARHKSFTLTILTLSISYVGRQFVDARQRKFLTLDGIFKFQKVRQKPEFAWVTIPGLFS